MLTVVGRGTVGCLTVAHFLRYTDWEIRWVYDSSVPASSVGEGTGVLIPQKLSEYGFSAMDLDEVYTHIKLGIKKKGWGKTGRLFTHDFPTHMHGIHFNAALLQDYMFNKLSLNKRVKSIDSKIVDVNDLDSDFIMVCTGSPSPSNLSDYNAREYIPVNACLVNQCLWDYPRFDYTLTNASKFGWVFGIPTKNRCSIGYLFNSDLSSEEEVRDDAANILEDLNLTSSSSRVLKFNNYSRKENYQGRIVYNGNSSFFLEPLEATSTGVATIINQAAYDTWSNNLTSALANQQYNELLDEIEVFIMLHYMSGSTFKSSFWDHARDKGKAAVKNAISLSNSSSFQYIKRAIEDRCVNYHSDDYFAPVTASGIVFNNWPLKSWKQNIEGLEILQDLELLLGENH